MNSLTRSRLAVLAACGLVFGLSGCMPGRAVDQEKPQPPTDEQIRTFLDGEVTRLIGSDYPEASLVRLRMKADGSLICGWLVHPGEKPAAFAAVDGDPSDLERKLWIPPFTREGSWRDPLRFKQQDIPAEMCRAQGLLEPEPSSEGAS